MKAVQAILFPNLLYTLFPGLPTRFTTWIPGKYLEMVTAFPSPPCHVNNLVSCNLNTSLKSYNTLIIIIIIVSPEVKKKLLAIVVNRTSHVSYDYIPKFPFTVMGKNNAYDLSLPYIWGMSSISILSEKVCGEKKLSQDDRYHDLNPCLATNDSKDRDLNPSTTGPVF